VKYKIVRPKPQQSPRAKKAMTLAKEIGLTDEERYEFARWLPTVDKDTGGSWKELDEVELHDLLTMMEGFVYGMAIFGARGAQ
jgi:hypothetical protein